MEKWKRNTIWGIALGTGAIGLAVLIVFIIILSFNFNLTGKFLPEETGITGDFIGGVVGTFWSMTGILLFYLAITYQREDLQHQKEALVLNTEELSLQREELELQRLEMTETRKVVKEQSETMKLQKFETTFFNLIRNHSELIEAMYHKPHSSAEPVQGYEVL
ncbi:MAG: hypothetical protein JKY30_13680, partial [Flavobacteriales bacterium]|nr:hypothetical protein [Flavobacteriales bacterium]